MSLLQRRMRVSWGWFVGASIFASLTIVAFATEELLVLPGRHTHGRVIATLQDADAFALGVACYIVLALVGFLFSFYQFRRGSWFNPI